MAKEIFDRISVCIKNNLPFVVYRKPNTEELVAIFQNNDTIHFVDDFSESGFVFAPYDLSTDAILLQQDEVIREPIKPTLVNIDQKHFTESLVATEKEHYMAMVAKALDYIATKAIDKVVLSRKINVNDNTDKFSIFNRMLSNYSNAFCYFWHHPKIGTWMGATPEILIQTKGAKFTTMSLAGTQNANELADPIWTSKEVTEQQMVTDYIKETLKDTVTDLEVSEVESVKAGRLWHLRTKIKGRFEFGKLANLIKVLHPTPAVCGTPIEKAKQFINDNEFYNRAFYTGFLGELNLKKELPRNRNRKNQENSAYRSVVPTSELFVNLRCMQMQEDKVSIYVGGGITSDSDPEKEWEETVLKSNTMLRVLGGN